MAGFMQTANSQVLGHSLCKHPCKQTTLITDRTVKPRSGDALFWTFPARAETCSQVSSLQPVHLHWKCSTFLHQGRCSAFSLRIYLKVL